MSVVSPDNSKAPPCVQCKNLQRLDRSGRPRRLETTVASLESSAESGCRFCQLIVSGIDICLPEWEAQRRAKSSLYELEGEFPFEGLSLCLDWVGPKTDRQQASIDFFTLPREVASPRYFSSTSLIFQSQRIIVLGLA